MRRRSFVYYSAASVGAAVLSFLGYGKQIGGPSNRNRNLIRHDEGHGFESSRKKDKDMKLGAFSVSLAVKDIEASKKFYEKLGFKSFAGDQSKNWLILKNGDHVIGLFQGLFERNILTFNPGWDQNAKKLDEFTDVRELQRQLKEQGVKFTTEADEKTKGPASFSVTDPDGNPILFDQHV